MPTPIFPGQISLVTHETQYFADPFPAPPGRSALAEPIPARE
jgi:hypothetical protein